MTRDEHYSSICKDFLLFSLIWQICLLIGSWCLDNLVCFPYFRGCFTEKVHVIHSATHLFLHVKFWDSHLTFSCSVPNKIMDNAIEFLVVTASKLQPLRVSLLFSLSTDFTVNITQRDCFFPIKNHHNKASEIQFEDSYLPRKEIK